MIVSMLTCWTGLLKPVFTSHMDISLRTELHRGSTCVGTVIKTEDKMSQEEQSPSPCDVFLIVTVLICWTFSVAFLILFFCKSEAKMYVKMLYYI